jgi:L-ribulokinase
MATYTIGVDFGTDSVRALVVDCANGDEIASSVFVYPRWAAGEFCDAASSRFRQHPLDYLEGLEASIRGALEAAPRGTAEAVRGISVDTTGSTPCPADEAGRPLALSKAFEDDPDAMFFLWKDHTSVAEAAEINAHARSWPAGDYTRFSGGVYSSEWYWSKILRATRANSKVANAAKSWVEHCDWMPAVLAGVEARVPRGRCSSGHKALWHASWGGYPPATFFAALDPRLGALRDSLPPETLTADRAVGGLCAEWAKRLGLREGIAIGSGAFDAHMGAVGVGVKPGWLIRIMGTSTCDIMASEPAALGGKAVRGICGQVDGSVLPGLVGLEAGQSAFGDLYAWFRDLLAWAPGDKAKEGKDRREWLLKRLDEAAESSPIDEGNPVFVDWLNGRRTPDADQGLKGALLGLSLGIDAPRLYRAIVEGSAFGSKAIVERFRAEGVHIDGIIGTGGVAKKSAFAMQVLSDVLEMPIRVAGSVQGCARGAAIFASVAAGVHPSVEAARDAMASPVEREYLPNASRAKAYRALYRRYLEAGAFIEGGKR